MSLSKYNTTTKELEPIAGGFDVEGILENIGDLTELDTTDKSSLVDAINEVKTTTYTKTEVDNLLDEVDNSITALIETSPSTKAYAVDDYLTYNHVIYHVKAAIAIGDTLTVGINIEVATISEGTVVFTDDESSAPAGSVAHVIVNGSGVTMAQRNKLKFVGLDVTDDSANDTTVISNKKTNDAIEAMENVLGAKNLLPTGESGTYSGLTFTVNADGSITISGTASGNVYYTIACPKLYAGDYILTGYPSSAIGMNCSLYYDGVPGSDTGDGQPFTLSQYVDNKNVYIYVLGGTNFATPVTFYPMIRPAGTDPTYVPYAMTNRELTERVSERYVSVTGDGVKTNQQLFNDLYSLVDSTKINKKSRFAIVHTNSTFWILSVSAITPNRYRFDGIVEQDATVVSAYHVQLSSTLGDCIRITNDIQTGGIQSTDLTLNAPSADYEYRVYY